MLLADVGMLGCQTRVNRPLFVLYRRLNRKCGLSVYHSGTKPGRGANGQRKSFVVADIPGLIEGAAEGAGWAFAS